mmetsp:Transcript_13944/g.20858  ORF Transcript_13944/g.20858 Transcript_13944/m.20858 type:complete len:204 (-) Transcript_13944:168-779(-)
MLGPHSFKTPFKTTSIAGKLSSSPYLDDTLSPFSNEFISSKNKFSKRRQLFQNQKQIGLTLVSIGILLTILGMILFFEKNLLRLGNILFIAGISMVIGPQRVGQFFFQPKRLQSTAIFMLGLFMVLTGRSKLGIIFEVLGLLNLFGNVLPLVLAMLKTLPVVGDIIRSLEQAFQRDSRRDRSSFSRGRQFATSTSSDFYSPRF